MQLKSGNEFVVGDDLRNEIAGYNSRLCSPSMVSELSRFGKIISVGDVTTENLHKDGIIPFLEIVDLRTKRGIPGEYRSKPGAERIRNDPGTLSHDLFIKIERMLRQDGGRIEITGEEDLAVIPIIYYSDINTVVVYGVPDVGMACIVVDRTIKDQVKTIINRMEVRCPN